MPGCSTVFRLAGGGRPPPAPWPELLARLQPGLTVSTLTTPDPAAALRRGDAEAAWVETLPDPLPEALDWTRLPAAPGTEAACLLFPAADARLRRIRSLFVNSVVFVGAGPGDPGLCTLAGAAALERCQVCLYDALVAPELLERLPSGALALDVGKRCGRHHKSQGEIGRLLTVYAREGRRVVRLKGGDPGIFGRLAEETAALDHLALPYRVIPGVSSLAAATTGTGMLLTRRGLSRGFEVLTPRQHEGDHGAAGPAAARPPLAVFMAVQALAETTAALLAAGRPADEPACLVLAASTPAEEIVAGTLADLVARVADRSASRPGLLLVGEVTRYRHARTHGALAGRRVWLPQPLPGAADRILDLGGLPRPGLPPAGEPAPFVLRHLADLAALAERAVATDLAALA